MDELSKWSGLCAAAGPIVRAKVRKLAGRHRLQPCDRDDLEQEIYLELLAGWAAAGLSESARGEPPPGSALCSLRDDGHTATLQVDLTREVERVAGSLVRPRSFWRRERSLPPSAAAVLVARPSACRPDGHDLRLDMAVALAHLPDNMRGLCRRLILTELTAVTDFHPQQPDMNALAEVQAQAVPLRLLFTSLGLHQYL